MIQTKTEVIDLIYSSYNQAKQHTNTPLRIQKYARKLLDAIGKPDANKNIVLVTGSKGKGSTASFIASLLQTLGFKTGLFTSPHYFSFNERIQVNGRSITDNDFVRLANDVAPYVANFSSRLQHNEYVGPIAINLAIALLYFSEKKVDFIILEAGKGGKDDDTNVVSNGWSVITPILDEHIDELGPTLSHIIAHKLGIIKNHSKALISKQQKEVLKELNSFLNQRKNVTMYGEDFSVWRASVTDEGMEFDFQTKRAIYRNAWVPLLGTFQCENIALAVQTCEDIIQKPIEQSIVHNWLHSLKNIGRCELLQTEPVVITDATINRYSADYLKEIVTHFSPKFPVAILGLSSDKDYKGIINSIQPFIKELFISQPVNAYKSFALDDVYRYSSKLIQTHIFTSPEKALASVLHDKKYDFVFILGNHSFIAEIQHFFKMNKHLLSLT